MIGRSLGQTIEVLGQEWRFKGQAEEAALQSSTNPFLLTKRVGGKQGGVPCGDRFKLDLGDHSLNWQFGVMALQETMALVHHILQFLIAAFCLIFPGDPGATLRKGPQPNTQSLTHSLTHPPSHSLTHSLTHLTHPPHSLTHLTTSLTHTLTHSLTHARTHSLTHSPTHSLTHSLRFFCVAGVAQCALPRGRMYALASLGSPPLLRGRRGTMCMYALASLGCLRLFRVAGVAQCALPRGRMYALASLGSPPLLRGRRGTMCTAKGSDVRPGVPWVSASFAWQAWHNVHCQGVGCTPWRPVGSPPFLRGRRGTMCTAKGSDVRPGVPWVSVSFVWQAWHNVHCQGVGCALASLGSPPLLRGRRGTMCTAKGSDVRPGVPWVSASFAWQAWHNVHCQGVGCTPWRPSGLRLFCVAGVAQCALPRGRMYALASPGSPPLLCGRRGTMCTAKGSDVRPGVPWVSAAFAWQAWHNVHVRPGVPWVSPPLSRGRRGTMCTAKGSDIRPGVPWVSASFAWQAWHNVHCQGVGCTPWRPSGLRLFCVAGVAQCALPRGRMYALASPGSPPLLCGRRGTMCTAKGSDVRPGVPWVSASFAWQAWHNVHCLGSPSLIHSLTHARTHARSLSHTDHTHITHTHQPHITHSHSHSLTCTCTYIHTHTLPTITPPSPLITRPPSPLHHSYHSSSLLAFLCSV